MTDDNIKMINNNFQEIEATVEKVIDILNELRTQVRKCTEDIATLAKRMDTYELHTSADSYNNILGACK